MSRAAVLGHDVGMKWLLVAVLALGCSKQQRNGEARLPEVTVDAGVGPEVAVDAAAPTAAVDAGLGSVLLGKWRASGSVGGGQGHPAMGWTLEYDFKPDGTFRATGYPQIEITGRWVVLNSTGLRAHVRLTERKMTGPGGGPPVSQPDLDETAHLNGKSMEFNGKTFTQE
jgi:hypothetical protein